MKKRLKNGLTTGLGLILLGSSLAFVATGKATIAEVSGFITMALALMLSKDEPFKNNFTPGQ
jgi:hypothetical protein